MAFLGMLVGLLKIVAIDPSSNQDLLGDICSSASDPTICFQMIKEILGAAVATTLESLAILSFPFARSTGAEDVTYIKSLAGSATDATLKMNYDLCAEHYESAVGNLEDAEKSKDYFGASTSASACIDYVETCNDIFSDTEMTDPSDLPKKGKEFSALCVIVLIISNKMGGT